MLTKTLKFSKRLLTIINLINGNKYMLFLATLVLLAAIGFGAAHFLKPDSPIEEKVEQMFEDEMEMNLELPPGCLHNTIDFSPGTPEKKV